MACRFLTKLHKAFLQGGVKHETTRVWCLHSSSFHVSGHWACAKEARRMFEISRTGLVICRFRLRLPAFRMARLVGGACTFMSLDLLTGWPVMMTDASSKRTATSSLFLAHPGASALYKSGRHSICVTVAPKGAAERQSKAPVSQPTLNSMQESTDPCRLDPQNPAHESHLNGRVWVVRRASTGSYLRTASSQ
jgi:hypothetical protein